MRHWRKYSQSSVAVHEITRRCRRCERSYLTSDQDPNNLCLDCLHNKNFEKQVAEWFLKNPFAPFEVYTSVCDDRMARVFLKERQDWVEYEDPHPVYLEAVRRHARLAGEKSPLGSGRQKGGEP